MGDTKALVPAELIEAKIYLIRGQKVILDSDLAELFCVETKRLNEQVKRNLSRFPEDFMFQLTKEETQIWHRLRSQIATLKRGQHLKYQPYAFTEHGVAMLSSLEAYRLAGMPAKIWVYCKRAPRGVCCKKET